MTTKEIADSVGIHVNTVRFYESIGFLTAPARAENGYRLYTPLHCMQCALIRRAMRAEVMQNGLRKQAVLIVRLCAALDFDGAETAANAYAAMIDGELARARAAIEAAKKTLARECADEAPPRTRKEAADALGVTSETLRTWERSGLIAVGRGENGYRAYRAEDMARLNIVRTLRCANYSLSAILRLLSGLDNREARSVEAALDTPGPGEDVVTACDRLVRSLRETRRDTQTLTEMIRDMRTNFATLQ